MPFDALIFLFHGQELEVVEEEEALLGVVPQPSVTSILAVLAHLPVVGTLKVSASCC